MKISSLCSGLFVRILILEIELPLRRVLRYRSGGYQFAKGSELSHQWRQFASALEDGSADMMMAKACAPPIFIRQ